jgi:hypothetical protein
MLKRLWTALIVQRTKPAVSAAEVIHVRSTMLVEMLGMLMT